MKDVNGTTGDGCAGGEGLHCAGGTLDAEDRDGRVRGLCMLTHLGRGREGERENGSHIIVQ